ncbi:MAG TPA: hypothetical protein PK864_08305 [Syntrophorhabdaceae bacterium]|nr:hypothetical protein [Syntrophorhabdaceae bacterium]HOL06301.1 hypothetical protein [Syntrophorhabdaceae bacterium]HON86014.1 hypothetical protein [Syntrophorhabdaceae bacterium]HOT41867.1 hypothetical protein [Syntrophorhabdaceae bacterium]HPC67372.1 hypothetical protein [Syntrophorhabdaceae bacterium]
MITLEMDKEEVKMLINIIERYLSHLEVEIVRTHHREFRNSLKEREGQIKVTLEKLKKLVD